MRHRLPDRRTAGSALQHAIQGMNKCTRGARAVNRDEHDGCFIQESIGKGNGFAVRRPVQIRVRPMQLIVRQAAVIVAGDILLTQRKEGRAYVCGVIWSYSSATV